MSDKESPVQFSKAQRLLRAGVAAWVFGRDLKMKIRGPATQMRAIAEAISATRALNEELAREDATVDSVVEKMTAKRAACEAFHRECGIPWPV